MRGRQANIILGVCALLISVAIAETTLRVYLATRLGSAVLWYGTRFNRKEIRGMYERERWAANNDPRALRGDSEERHTVRRHDNQAEGYSKFFPSETKYTYDID